VCAVHLLQRARGAEIELTIVDSDGSFGPGVAYATRDPLHVLNVPAVRMGAISGHPEHFHAWLRRRGHPAGPEDFLPRSLFGTYLRGLLGEAEGAAAPAAVLERRTGTVVSVRESAAGEAPLELVLEDGDRLLADHVVLALGPLPGGDPVPVPPELLEQGTYVSDPWAEGALDPVREDRSVLIVGTGLTMVDVAVSLGSRRRGPRMRAVSRHGLVPRRHRADLTRVSHFPLPLGRGLEPIVAAVLEEVGRVAHQGGDWRDVIDSMRPSTPALWRSLAVEDKRRFLDGLQRFWDVHRFRMAPAVADRFQALQERDRLQVGASAVSALEPYGGRARAYLHVPGRKQLEAIDVDRVINCAGAGLNLAAQAQSPLRELLAAGSARADALGIGVDVAASGALIDVAGRASARIHVAGALRKGCEWEAIGITEIRDHAAKIAELVLGVGAGANGNGASR
ncbi:MAG: FAD/NAD(P)-binding protein, partial [Solirubrobacterales bacterium]